jgi:hypothetical protein
MPRKPPVLFVVVLVLFLAGAAFAQQMTMQHAGLFGFGENQSQPRQTFSGAVDRVGNDYVLIAADDVVYQLEVEEEMLIEGFVLGQEVEVLGILEEHTIDVAAIHRPGRQPQGLEEITEDRQQQEENQTVEILGIGSGTKKEMKTYTGVVNRVNRGFVLIVENRAYQLDIADDRLVADIVRGQEVEILGTLEENTIRANRIKQAE